MNTSETPGVKISGGDVNGHYMWLCSLTPSLERDSLNRFQSSGGKCQVIVLLNYVSSLFSERFKAVFAWAFDVLMLFCLSWFILENPQRQVWSPVIYFSLWKENFAVCGTTYSTCVRWLQPLYVTIKWVDNTSWQFLKERHFSTLKNNNLKIKWYLRYYYYYYCSTNWLFVMWKKSATWITFFSPNLTEPDPKRIAVLFIMPETGFEHDGVNVRQSTELDSVLRCHLESHMNVGHQENKK